MHQTREKITSAGPVVTDGAWGTQMQQSSRVRETHRFGEDRFVVRFTHPTGLSSRYSLRASRYWIRCWVRVHGMLGMLW